jgi:predicted RNA-binding protein YlxR (DUF448 family)
VVHGVEPVRTCVGCRNRAPASKLLRVVARVDVAVPAILPDPRRRLPGRGAYLHVDPGCLAKADRRRAFSRALRVAGILDTGALASYVADHAVSTEAGVSGQTDGGR